MANENNYEPRYGSLKATFKKTKITFKSKCGNV